MTPKQRIFMALRDGRFHARERKALSRLQAYTARYGATGSDAHLRRATEYRRRNSERCRAGNMILATLA